METLSLPPELQMAMPDAPSTAPAVRFEVKRNGEKREYLAAVWKDDGIQNPQFQVARIFMRPVESEHEELFALKYVNVSLNVSLQEYTRTTLKKDASSVFSPSSVHRSIHFPDGKQAYLQESRSQWLDGKSNSSFRSEEIYNCHEFYSLSNDNLRKRLEFALQNSESEAAFALRWLEWDEEKQLDYFCECRNGDWRELRGFLLQLSLVLAHDMAEEIYGLDWEWWTGRFDYGDYFYGVSDEKRARRWERLILNWYDALRDYFLPFYLLQEVSAPLCLAHFGHENFTIEIQNGSAHQLLEAQLQLTEWARKHFPDRPELLAFPAH